MPPITRAISIRQPFVELILQGKKKYEYRSTPTKIFERVFIYASLKDNPDPSSWRKLGISPEKLKRGKIVGSVEIVGCIKLKERDYKYVLRNPKRIKKVLQHINQPTPKFWFPKFKK